ncbi:hypothetical protein IF650_05680 [Cellulosimicrobium terreum]|nr:hypothetical protein [Cellulosimicrobium terreum]
MASVEPRAEQEVAPDASVASGSLHARTSVPVLPPTTVTRPGLDLLLAPSFERRLTLVSAGPGWGKTTTVAAWARSRPDARIAWLTLEPFDDTPAAFWTDVLAALRASGAVPPGHPLDRLDVPSGMSSDLQRRILRALELLPDPVVLVLDDLHHVAGTHVTRTLDDLLRYPLPLHLVALSRIDPPLMLQRLRGQGEITELGVAELAFDAPSVASLGARHGRTLCPAEIEQLLDETGGWAVGVRLQVEAPTGPAGRARADRSAAEYLLAEVLDRQDTATRRFLLRTSLASTVCVELAEALDPGAPAARLLPGLASSHGFVTAFGEQRTWFRYHPLLREMLQNELRLEDPAAVPAVHRAAARWLLRHGEPLRALEHAVLSEDWRLVGQVFVEGAATHLAGPHRDAVGDLLRRVPFADLEPDVELHLSAGSLALVDERLDATAHHVDRARALLDQECGRPGSAAAVLVELLEVSTSRSVGDVRVLAAAAGAALAAADAVPFPFPALETYRALARAHRQAGLAWCASSSVISASPAPPPARVVVDEPDQSDQGDQGDQGDEGALGARSLVDLGAQAARALLDVSAGRVADGEARARTVLEAARARGWATHVQSRAAHAALAWAQHLHAVDAGLDRALSRSLAADVGGREPASETAVRLLQARVAASRGHARAAWQALDGADHALGNAPAPPVLADLWVRATTEVHLLDDAPTRADVRGGSGSPRPSRVDREGLGSPAVTAVCRARRLLAAGRADAALRAVDEVAGAPSSDVDDLTRVEAALVEASVLARAGSRRAEPAVDRALVLAGAEHLAHPFLTVPGVELRATLVRAVAHGDAALLAHLRSLLGREDAGPEPAPLVEPLTERELAMLAVLPTMESNLEIAEDFFVSVNTVKAHLKSLYRKLGVGTRRDAVRRGRDLGILP